MFSPLYDAGLGTDFLNPYPADDILLPSLNDDLAAINMNLLIAQQRSSQSLFNNHLNLNANPLQSMFAPPALTQPLGAMSPLMSLPQAQIGLPQAQAPTLLSSPNVLSSSSLSQPPPLLSAPTLQNPSNSLNGPLQGLLKLGSSPGAQLNEGSVFSQAGARIQGRLPGEFGSAPAPTAPYSVVNRDIGAGRRY